MSIMRSYLNPEKTRGFFAFLEEILKEQKLFFFIIFCFLALFSVKPAMALQAVNGDQALTLSSPVGNNIEAGARSKLLLHQVKLTSDEGAGSGCTIESITITETGTADGLNDYDRVHIIIDANNNGVKDTDENPLSASAPFSFPADGGSLTINLNQIAGGRFGIGDGASVQIFIAVDTKDTFAASTADTLKITVDQIGASQWSTGTARNWTGTLTSREIRAIGKVTYAQGPSMPAASSISSEINQTDYPVFQFDLTAGKENLNFNTITLKETGTINESTALTNVKIIYDTNQNGTFESGTEAVFASGGTFVGGLCSLNPNRMIAENATETYLVLVSTVNGNFNAGETIKIELDTPATAFNIIGDSSGQSVVSATNTAQTGNAMTGTGSFTAAAGASTPAAGNTAAGVRTGIPVQQITITASAEENVNISAITITEAGTASGTADISRVWCAVDIDGNGVLNGAEAEQSTSAAGNAVFNTDDGTATLTFNTPVLAGPMVNLLIFYDTTANFTGNETLVSKIDNPAADIQASGAVSFPVSGQNINCSTLTAITSNTLTGIGTLSIALGANSPSGGVNTGANNNLSVLQLRFTAGTGEDVKINQIILEETDNAQPDQDITLVSIADDSDGNGLYTTGDTIFGTSTISAAGVSTVNLTLNDLIVQSGTSRDIIVMVNTDGTNFAFNDKLRFRIVTPSNDIAANGTVSNQTVQALVGTITGNQLSGAGSISMTVNPLSPANGVTLEGAGTNYPVWLLTFTATNDEAVLIDTITIEETGTCDASLDISSVGLVYDADDDGIYDPADPAEAILNNTGTGTFNAPNGTITLDPTGALADAALTIPAGGSRSYFVTASPGASFTGGKTIIFKISNIKQSYSARGVSSGFTVSDPASTQITSSQILARGSYLTAQGDAPQTGGINYGVNTLAAFAHFKITAGGEAVNISSIKLTEAGSAHGTQDMSNIGLVIDDGAGTGGIAGDGIINGTEGLLAGTGTGADLFSGDNGTVTLTPSAPVNIPANSSRNFIVTCNTIAGSPGFEVTDVLKAVINDPDTDITATGVLSSQPLLDISGNTLIGSGAAGLTAQGIVRMKAGPNMPPASGIPYGANSDVPVLQVTIGAHGEGMDIKNLKISESGTADGVLHIGALNFAVDNFGGSGNGLFDGGETHLVYTSAGHPGFAANNGTETAVFDVSTPLVVPAGTSVELLVLFDTTADFPVNTTLRPQISNLMTAYEAQGSLTGFTLYDPSTFSISGNDIRSTGKASVALGADTPLTGGTTAGTRTDLVAAQFVLTPSGENITFSSLRITETGTAHAVDDITGIDLVFEDFATANGLVDGAETKVTLTSGRTFSSDNSSINLTFAGEPVTIGSPLSILLLVNTDNSFLVSENDSLAFSIAAPGTDLGLTGLLSARTVVCEPVGPVASNALTAAGTIGVSAGPAMPAAGEFVQGVHSRIPVLQLRFTAAMENINITNIMITETGTCDETAVLGNAGLVIDSDSSGTINGLEALASGTGRPEDVFAPGGVITLTPDTPIGVPAGGFTDVLVVCDTLAGFSGGDTIVFSLNDPSTDYAAVGALSAINLSDSGSGAIISNTMTGIGTVSMALGDNTPLTGGTAAGLNENTPVMQLKVTAGTENILISSITVMEAGSANGMSDITACGLVIDTNGNGAVDSGLGEAKVSGTGTQTFANDNGRLTLTPDAAIEVPAGTDLNILVVYDTASTFVIGKTLRCEITNPSVDYVCVGASSLKTITDTSTTSIVSNSLTGAGTISASLGTNTPGNLNIRAGVNTGVTGLQLAFAAGNGESIKITSIKLTETGTADASNDIRNVGIVIDDGAGSGGIAGDGIINGSEQVLSGTQTALFNGPDGTITLVPDTPLSIPAGITRNILIVFDTTASFEAGDTIQFVLADPSADYLASGLTSTQPVRDTSDVSVTGNTLTGTGTLNVSAGLANPGDSILTAGTVFTEKAVLQLRLDAGSVEPLTLGSIKVTETGTILGDTEISQVDLVIDLNGNGIKDGAETVVNRAGDATFTANNGTLVLTPSDIITIPASGSLDLLVVVNLTSNIAAGKTVKLTISDPSLDVVVTGQDSNKSITSASSASISSGTFTYSGNFALSLGASTPLSGGINAGINTNVPVMQLTFTAGPGENVKITSLTVTEAGTAHGTNDITAVGLVIDTNGNGIADSGETILSGTGSNTFSSDNGTIILTPSQPIEIGANLTANVIVTASTSASFSATASPADSLVFKINNPSTDCTGLGAASNLGLADPSDVSIVSNTITAAGGIALTTGPANPLAGGIPYSANTGINGMHLRFTASNIEDITIDSIILTEFGTVMGNTEITGIGLFLDDGAGGGTASDGIQNGTELTLVNAAAGTFAADNGNITLVPGSTVTVPAGQSRDLMVTFNTDASLIVNRSIKFKVNNPSTDYIATGVNSLGRIRDISTYPVESGTLTSRGIMNVALGPNPAAGSVPAGENDNLVVAQLLIEALGEQINFTGLTIYETGTAHGVDHINNVSVIADNGAGTGGAGASNGIIDGSEAPIGGTGITGFSADNSSLSLTFSTAQTIAAGNTASFLIAFDSTAAFSAGSSFKISINTPESEILARGQSSLQVIPCAQTGIINGPVLTARGAGSVSAGPANPASRGISAVTNNTFLSVLQFTIMGTGENMLLNSVTLTESGSANASAAISLVNIYEDINENGRVDTGENPLGLTGGVLFGAGDQKAQLTLDPPVLITAGTAKTFIAVIDTDASQFITAQTLIVSIADPSVDIDITGQGSLETIALTGGAVSGGTFTGTGDISLSFGPANPGAAFITDNAGLRVAGQLLFTAAGEDMTITGITIEEAGSANGLTQITGVFLYPDDGGSLNDGTPDDGIINGSEAALAMTGPASFNSDNGKAVLAFPVLSAPVITAGSSANFLVVLNTSNTFKGGDTLRIRIVSPDKDYQAQGVTSGTAVRDTSSLALEGASLTAKGTIAAQAGPANPGASSIPGGQRNNVPVMQIKFTAGSEDVKIESINITEAGSASGVSDISAVNIIPDNGGSLGDGTANDGIINGSETALALSSGGTFSTDNTSTQLVLDQPFTIAAEDSVNFIIAASTTASFQTVQGDALLFNLSDPSADYSARGVLSNALINDASAIAITAGPLTAIGNLQVFTGPAMPAQTNIPSGAVTTNAVLAQYKLTAGGEDIIIDSIKISRLGSCQDSDIDAVRLIFDDGGPGNDGIPANGLVEGSEAALAGASGVFSSGSYTFDISGADPALRTVPINDELNFIIQADVNTGFAAGETLWTAVADPSADISGQGSASLQPVSPAAITMIQSNIFTSAGTLAVSAGDNPIAADVLAEGINTDVPVLQFKIAAFGETVNVTGITVTEKGSAHGTQDITGVYLVLDDGLGGGTAGDAVYTIGETVIASTVGGVFSGDNSTLFFNLAADPLVLNPGSSYNVLVVMNTASSFTGSKTLECSIENPSIHITASGQTSGAAIRDFANTAAISSSAITAVGSLGVSAGPGNPLAGPVDFGVNTGVELLGIQFVSGFGEPVNVSSITVKETGNANGNTDFSDLYLLLDDGSGGGTAGNGVIDGTEGTAGKISGTWGSVFAADNGTLTFTPDTPLQVQPGTPLYIIAAGDTTASFGVGETLSIEITDPALDIAASGALSAKNITVSGSAVTGNTMTASGKISLAAGTVPAPGTFVPAGDNQNIIAMGLVFSALGENCSVSSITLSESGTIDAQAHITGCGLIIDSNKNNIIDPGETLLAGTGTQVFNGPDGKVTIVPSSPFIVNAGQSVNVFAVINTGSDFGDARTIIMSIADPSADYSALGVLTGQTVKDSSSAAVTANELKAVVPCSNLTAEITPLIINADGVTVNSFTYAFSPVIGASNSGVNRFKLVIPSEYTSPVLLNVKKGGAYLSRGIDYTDQVVSNVIQIDLASKMTLTHTGTEVVLYFTAVSPGYAQVGAKEFEGYADDTVYSSPVKAVPGNAGPSVDTSSLVVTAGGVEYFVITASDSAPLTGKASELIITAMDKFNKIVTFYDGNITVSAASVSTGSVSSGSVSAPEKIVYSGTSVSDNKNGTCSVANTGSEWSNGILKINVSYSIAGEEVLFTVKENDTGLNKTGTGSAVVWQSEQAVQLISASSTGDSKIELTNGTALVIPPGSLNQDMSITIKQNSGVIDRDENNVKIPDPEDLNLNLSSVRQDAANNSTLVSFDITPHNTVLAGPAEFSVPIPAYITPVDQNKLRFYQWDGYEWIGLGGSVVTINSKPFLQTAIQRFGLMRMVKVSNLSTIDGGKLIQAVSFVNNPFSPNDDGINDNLIVRITLSKSAVVTLKVYDSAGDLIHKIASAQSVPSGENSWEWRGKTRWGDSVEPGIYILRIEISTPSGGANENAMIGVVH